MKMKGGFESIVAALFALLHISNRVLLFAYKYFYTHRLLVLYFVTLFWMLNSVLGGYTCLIWDSVFEHKWFAS